MDPIFFAPSARTMYFLTAHLVVKLKSSSNSLRYLCFFSIETIRHGLNRKLYRRTLHQNLPPSVAAVEGLDLSLLFYRSANHQKNTDWVVGALLHDAVNWVLISTLVASLCAELYLVENENIGDFITDLWALSHFQWSHRRPQFLCRPLSFGQWESSSLSGDVPDLTGE